MLVSRYGIEWKPLLDTKGKAFAPRPDWLIELDILRDYEKCLARSDEIMTWEEHFMKFCEIIWDNERTTEGSRFIWNPYAKRMLKHARSEKFMGISGHASCVRGDTRILDPVTGEQPTIKELCESGKRPTVMTLNGPVLAGVPFIKGKAKLYEFSLDDGSVFRCTANHRILTPSGYLPASSCVVGSEIYGASVSPHHSNSERAPLAQKQDGLHCTQTQLDSQSNCSAYSHQYDGRLLSARASAQETPPSLSDVQGCMEYVFDGMDGSLLGPKYSRLYRLASRPSKRNASLRRWLWKTVLLYHFYEETSSPLDPSFQQFLRYSPENSQSYTSASQDRHCDHTHNSHCDDPCEASLCLLDSEYKQPSSGSLQSHSILRECSSVCEKPQLSSHSSRDSLPISYTPNIHIKRVQSILETGEDVFYDLQVPVEHHYFAEGAIHHNSGKSQFGAIWALANFFIGGKEPIPEGSKKVPKWDPYFFKAFITSTTLDESRGRIWGVVETYWKEACKFFGGEANMPGKLITSRGKIVGKDRQTGKWSDLSGLALIAGGKGHDAEAASKIGFKAPRMIMIADELPMLTHGLYASASNLAANDDFQMIGIGNPDSIFDPFGLFITPIDGWSTVDENSEGWKTEIGGYCIRFDGHSSPNVLEGKRIFPGLLTKEMVDAFRERLGPNSAGYWRMVRGFISPTGSIDSIYTEQEIVAKMAAKKCMSWVDTPVKISFLDPAFSHGGDRAAYRVMRVGKIKLPDGRMISAIENIHVEDLMLRVDAKHKTKDRNTQLVEFFLAENKARGVTNSRSGLDSTGGGDALYTIITMLGGEGFHAVSFAGAASDMPVSSTDKRPGKDRYANKVSELWYVGKDLLQSSQLYGLDSETMKEMTARTYKGTGEKEKVRVEPKAEMKKRTSGTSPDFADSLFGAIEIARRIGLLRVEGRAAAVTKARQQRLGWMLEWVNHKPVQTDAIQELSLHGSGWAE